MADISVFDVYRNWKISSISLEDLISSSESTDITNIYCNPMVRIDEDSRWIFADSKHPIVRGKLIMLGQFLALDEAFYDAHKAEIDDAIASICRNTTATYFCIESRFINEKTLKALSENKNINHLVLGGSGEKYKLTRSVYDLLKDSSIEAIDTKDVDDELKGIFNAKIYYNDMKPLISFYNYENLIELNSLRIEKPFTEEEIENIKYVKDGISIKICNFDDYENIFKIIRRLNECGKDYHCVIEVQYKGEKDYKNQFNEYIFTHLEVLDYDVDISVGYGEEYPLKDYAKYERRLIEMIRPALNLSPLEKYLFAYNITKKYKEYKENKDKAEEARNLYQILDGEFMVCVGYGTLLKDLLNKLGIESDYYSVGVDTGLDDVPSDALVLPDDVLVTRAGHARVMVNIVDPKYGVDGLYIADPTWDNIMDDDPYNFALMTGDEYNGLYRYNFLTFYNVQEMFFAHSIEEFYQKANIWMFKEEKKRTKSVEKELISDFTLFHVTLDKFMVSLKHVDRESYDMLKFVFSNIFKMKRFATNVDTFMVKVEGIVEKTGDEKLKENFKDLVKVQKEVKKDLDKRRNIRKMAQHEFMRMMIDSLEFIDKEAFASFSKENKELYQDSFEFEDSYVRDVMARLGEYVTRKANKEIPGAVLMDAVREMYRQTTDLTEEQLAEKMAHIIEYNKKRQEESFPVRYKILPDGTKTPYLNETNKFDIEERTLSA